MKFRGALLAATILAAPMLASAQPVTGLYVGAGAGLNIMQNESINSVDHFATPGAQLQTNLGAVGVASVGWGFGNGLRAEFEGDYRYNGLDKVTGVHGSAGIGGSEQKFGPMVNVLYDFYGLGTVVPYAGIGAGYQWDYMKFTSGGASASDTEGAFAYQAILGAAMPIASVPGLAITAEYRFMGLAGDRTYTDHGGSLTLNDNYNHSVLLGVRYAFGAPAPAMAPMTPIAAPAPAVQPARSYLVFFDWDKATLTDRARQIIKEAADNSTHVQYTRIDVNGYTDTSGTPQYNMGLSVRRADAVKGELVRDGVPVAVITTQGFGETHLLVPTGSGVREPQNRRVEIVIH
jgi:outer membrane protein OmpA-like peptidoglycan-associated protein/outer membrane protein W